MRTLHELYIILYDEIKNKQVITGFSIEITRLVINNKIDVFEYSILIKHFKNQKPNKNLHPEFLKSKTWSGFMYWWNLKEDTNPINRKKFIKKMCKITALTNN